MAKNESINIVIPASGLGSRFQQAGYNTIKPLIDVQGQPMIERVIDNIGIKGQYIFIIQEEHDNIYNISQVLKSIVKDCIIVYANGLTQGAACSVLLAKEYINNDNPLMIANSDQILEWDVEDLLLSCFDKGTDGAISVFESNHPKFSYAKVNETGFITEVAEKKVISNTATTGVYMFKRGADFVKAAEQMISKNIRVNNEFYVAPVYNEAILNGLNVRVVPVRKMWSIGDPESLHYYLREHS
jgi:dTDP-glucose pyrophosphorylase